MKIGRLGAFARLAALFGLALLVIQLVLVGLYIRDRGGETGAGYRFPLPERVIAMADLMDAADDPSTLLIALNTPDLLVTLADRSLADLASPEKRLIPLDRLYERIEDRLQGRDVAVFVALPDGVDPEQIRVGDRSVWTRYPMRMAIALDRGGVLVVETRDDLLTRIYSVPIGWWAGIFGAVAASIVLLALHVETRPIVRLAAAAQAFGISGRPRRIAPAGSREMRTLIDAFNRMQAGLDAHLTRRRVMLGALGHDLRTHLTRIGLRLDTLKPDDAAPFLSTLSRIERILENALALAGEEERLDCETVELRALVVDLVAEMPGEAIEIVAGPDVFARANIAALERILENLLDNALRHGTRARIVLAAHPPTLKVCDDGPGLTASERLRALEPFEVLDPARTQGPRGTGLGLAICRMLADAQGGQLRLDAHQPHGLCALLELRGIGPD